jgi:Flp pilus assembly protein TadD
MVLFSTGQAIGQELTLERAVPRVWDGCQPGEDQAVRPATSAQRQEAERLATAATQSSILGDNAAAFDYLRRAVLLDPASLEIRYHLARTLQELGRIDEALATLCLYAAAAGDAPEMADVRERIVALAEATVTSVAARAFETGIAQFDARRLPQAEAAFSQAIAAAPSWTAPIYNRAVTRLVLGTRDAAAADARAYVDLGGDPAQVAGLVAVLGPAAQVRSHNAGGALMAGLLVPGLGHFVTNRPATGALVLGAAGGAIAVGLSVQRTKVDCLSPPVEGQCPPAEVVGERTERPYLLAAVGVAAIAGVLGAIDAYRGARKGVEAPAGSRTGAWDVGGSSFLALSEIQLHRHGVSVELVRLSF